MKKLDRQVLELTDLIERLVSLMKVMDQDNLKNLDNEINFQELQVLLFLGKFGPHKMNEIAKKVKISVSNLTFIIDKLNEKDLVHRSRSEQDRRVVLVELSKKGMESFAKHREQKIDMSGRLLRNLNENERDQFLLLLKKSFSKY